MRDINRIEPMLNDLKELWQKHPDLRLCQLLSWLAGNSGWKNNDLFYLEDNVVMERIQKELLRN